MAHERIFRYEDSQYPGGTGFWEIVIGLEVHAQIISQSKLFSRAPTAFGAAPNTQVSYVDAAFPGQLPVLNGFCVRQAVKTGLGLSGRINLVSSFDRKNYFYPDLPSGYQISQLARPIVEGGFLDIERSDGTSKRVQITRVHMEQDAGKSSHDLYASATAIDLNRAGVGLMEIVSEPDMRTIEEAALYFKKLRALLRCLETCDGNMEEGSLRADANVSVRRPGAGLGTRVEIKNLNSIRFLQQALSYEVSRQVHVLENGGEIIQETRLFDVARGETRSMRSKEDAADYRYFPDPDLPPLVLTQAYVDEIYAQLPELPDQKKARLIKDFGLSVYDADVLVSELGIAAFFEKGTHALTQASPKILANWILGDFLGALNESRKTVEESPVSAEALAKLLDMIAHGVISGKIAKDVFSVMWETGDSPETIVAERGLQQVSDEGALLKMLQEILNSEPGKVADYRAGKEKLFGYFVGLAMKASQGRGNPALLNKLLKELLGSA